MKNLRILGFVISILGLIVPLLMPLHPAFASNTTQANYVITLDANSSQSYYNQTVNFTLGAALQSNNFIYSNYTNTAIQSSTGGDVAYMPPSSGNSTWSLWIDSIDANVHKNYFLYLGGNQNMSSKLSYFPGANGMTVTDSAYMLNSTKNWSLEINGKFNTSTVNLDKSLWVKQSSIPNMNPINIQFNSTNDFVFSTNYISLVNSNPSSPVAGNLIPIGSGVPTWMSQSFTASTDFYLKQIKFYWGYDGGLFTNRTTVFRIRSVDGSNKPTGSDLYTENSPYGKTQLGALYKTSPGLDAFNLSVPFYCSSGTKYALIYSPGYACNATDYYVSGYSNGTDSYAGGICSTSTDGGSTWTDKGYDIPFWIYGVQAFKIPINNSSSSDHTLKITSNDTAMAGYWDDLNTPVSVSSSPFTVNTAYSTAGTMSFVTNNTMNYMNYATLSRNNTVIRDYRWSSASTWGGDGVPTFATNNPNINISASEMNPVSYSICTGNTTEPSADLVSGVTSPGSNYATENMSPTFIGADYMNVMLDAGGIPRSFFWFIFAFGFAIGGGFLVYWLVSKVAGHTSSALLTQSIVSGVILAGFSIGSSNVVPFYCVIIFVIEALGIVLAQKQLGW